MPFTYNEKRLLFFTSGAHAISDSWHILFPSLLYLIALDFNHDYLFLGILANVMAVALGASGILSGFLSDKYSSRLLFGAFGVLCCLGCIAIALSFGRISIMSGMILLGLGTGIYHPVGLAAITRNFKRKSMGLGIHGLAGSLGMSILPVGAISIGVALGWRFSFVIGAVISISVVALLPLVPVAFDRPIKHSLNLLFNFASIRQSLIRRPLVALYGVAAIRQFSLIGFFTFMTTMIAQFGGLGEEEIAGLSTTGILATLVIAIGGIGAFIGGKLGERFPPETVLIAATLLTVPLMLLIGPARGIFLLLLLSMASLAYQAAEPQVGVLIGRLLPQQMHGKGFALLYGFSSVIGSAAGFCSGTIAQAHGVNWVFPASGTILLAAIILQWAYLGPKQVTTTKP